MVRIWYFLLERRSLTYMILVGLIGFGLFSVNAMRKESSPEVQIPVAIISTILPGASPTDVETLVTNEIEKAVANIENIKTLTSSSQSGVSVVSVEFEASANLTTSLQKVRDEVSKTRNNLPDDATDPNVTDINFADQPVLIAAVSSDLPVTEFKTLTDRLKDQIEQVNGVTRADIAGVRGPEVTVVVRRSALLTYGLSLTDVVASIGANNTAFPVGSIEQNNITYTVSLKSDITDPKEVALIPITTRSGQVLTLSEIAVVANGVEEARTISRISIAGKPATQAATVTVYKQRGANITSMTTDVIATLDTFATANKGVETSVSFDAGDQIRRDLSELSRTGIEAVLLVMLALFATLGWREALLAGISIPLSILVSFVALYESGNTINFISLFSLILSIGILVDSAIVITESIHVNIKKGLSRTMAARHALAEYSYPLIAGTLTTVAVFLPLFTISGVTGQFIKSIPFTVVFVLLASIFVALGLTPLIATLTLRARGESAVEHRQERYAEALRNWYRRNIIRFLDHKGRKWRFVLALVFGFIGAIALPIVGLVKVQFFPQGDVDFIYVEIEERPGTPLSRTDLATRGVEETLYDIPEIESFTTTVGRGSSFNDGAQSGARYASININLSKDRTRTSTEVVADVRGKVKQFTDITARVSEPNNGPPSGAPVVITFYGDDLTALKKLAFDAKQLMVSIPGTQDVTSSAESDVTEYTLSIDRTKAATLGLSPIQIAQILRTAVYGTEATTIKTQGDEIKVNVKTDLNLDFTTPFDTNRTTIDTLLELPVPTQKGTVILGTVVHPSLGIESDVIKHEDQKRIVTVGSQLASGAFAADVSSAFAKKASTELSIPQGITMKIGGENEDVNQSFVDMFLALIMGIALIFVILIIEFIQYRQAILVLSVVPLSLIGVLFGLLLTGQPVSFPTMLGFIALGGIVVNHAIILVDVFNRLRKEHPDMSIREVVIEGGATRLRPILLTKITAIIGLIPLLFASDLWRPIAVAMIFGLAFTGILTLIFIPILYLKWCKKTEYSNNESRLTTPTPDDDDNIINEEEEVPARSMEHVGDVLKKKYEISSLIKGIALLAVFSMIPFSALAYTYDNENIHSAYHEAPAIFSVDENGETLGATVSGIPFRQYGIANDYGIRLQRFEIGLAYWYVSDRGIIWADNDLTALSVYLSRTV
ncbi:MAG: efflux RND transporter permease subunit [Candidatus Pacebacteria bacterium]|nr:efflux RND transporter permease subunit [Candidatus Paceibacterota bacterium]